MKWLCFILSLFLVPNSVWSKEQIIIGVLKRNPGALEYRDERFFGQARKPFQCFVDNLSKPYELAIAPNSRLFALFEAEQIDVLLPLAQTKERDQIGHFANPLLYANFLIYSRNKELDMDNLAGAQIVSVRAAASNNRILDKKGELIEVQNYIQGVKMTKAHRADGVVFPEPAIGPLLEHLGGLHRHLFYRQKIVCT